MKRYQKYIAAALTICLTTSATFYYADNHSAKADNSIETTTIRSSEKTQVSKTASNLTSKKEEMVYIFANSDGSVDHTLVSACLKNPDSLSSINDISDLTDIVNVKGWEEFSKNGDSLTWAADGSDIYYQGKSQKELPVSVNITYLLDGNEISAQELAGKSGKVTIRFTYENHSRKQTTVGENQETLAVPYLAVTGTMFDLNQFANIEVTNGSVLTDGNRAVVLCLALPGMTESLQLKDDSLLPDYAEITADVSDFSLAGTVTVFTNQLFQSIANKDLDSLDNFSIDSLSEAISKLSEASIQLEDGSSDLYEGAVSLLSGTTSLDNGVKDLFQGATQLNSGASSLASGTKELSSGAKTVQDSVKTLDVGIKNTKSGADKLTEGYVPVLEGVSALTQGLKQTADGIDSLSDGMDTAYESLKQTIAANEQVLEGLKQVYTAAPSENFEKMIQTLEVTIAGQKQIAASMTDGGKGLKDGITALCAGTKTVSDGITSLSSGLNSLSKGTLSLKDGLTQLSEGSSKLVSGTSSLYQASVQVKDGTTTLLDGTKTLVDGADKLKDGSSKLKDGASDLTDGAKTLADGIAEFNETGIQKLVSVFDSDIELLIDRLSAITELSSKENNFSGLMEGMDGSVSYLLKTNEIEK